jgi:hypothetical protein
VTTGHKTGKAQGLYSNNIRKNNLGRKRKGRKEERKRKKG